NVGVATGSLLGNGTATGNTPYWDGSQWVVNSATLYNDGTNIGIGTSSPSHSLSVQNGFNVDEAGANNGYLDQNGSFGNGLSFGSGGSGEGIASDRNGGTNNLGLDFYTDYQNRLAITNSGSIGIGTLSPTAQLDVTSTVRFENYTSGYLTVDGNGNLGVG